MCLKHDDHHQNALLLSYSQACTRSMTLCCTSCQPMCGPAAHRERSSSHLQCQQLLCNPPGMNIGCTCVKAKSKLPPTSLLTAPLLAYVGLLVWRQDDEVLGDERKLHQRAEQLAVVQHVQRVAAQARHSAAQRCQLPLG